MKKVLFSAAILMVSSLPGLSADEQNNGANNACEAINRWNDVQASACKWGREEDSDACGELLSNNYYSKPTNMKVGDEEETKCRVKETTLNGRPVDKNNRPNDWDTVIRKGTYTLTWNMLKGCKLKLSKVELPEYSPWYY